MITEVILSFTNSKGKTFDLSSKEVYFEISSQDNLSFSTVEIAIYNSNYGFFQWLKPVLKNGDLFNNKNNVTVTAIVRYSSGLKRTIFSNILENVYQQIHTPPNSILTIRTYSAVMSGWINQPLKNPLVIKNRLFKSTCAEVLGSLMGDFNVSDFTISGVFYNRLDFIQFKQIDGLRVRYGISYENAKVNFVKAARGKTIEITADTGLRSVPVINTASSAYILEQLLDKTYYQIQFSTVFGLLSCGQSVKVRDYRGVSREGFIQNITRTFSVASGGQDTVVIQEGIQA